MDMDQSKSLPAPCGKVVGCMVRRDQRPLLVSLADRGVMIGLVIGVMICWSRTEHPTNDTNRYLTEQPLHLQGLLC